MKNKYIIMGILFILLFSLAGCKGENQQITDLSMLKGGKTFAVPTGTTADKFVLEKFPDAKCKYFNTALDGAIAVKNGKADAAVYDKPIMENIVAKNEGLEILPELLIEDKYGFAVQMENKELKTTIDAVVKELKANGTYDDMMKRWFPKKGAPEPMPNIKLTGNKGTLRLGTAAAGEPICFVDSSKKPVGFDIEIAAYIAQKLDMQLEIVNMDFGGLIPALAAGKVDMIAAGISITEERAKKVLFSESYYDGGIAVAVRSKTKTPAEHNSAKMKTVADLKDKRIGVLLGGIHDNYASKTYPHATVMQYKSPSDLILAVKTGKVDAAFYSHESMLEILRNDKELGFLSENLFRTPFAMGFNQSNDELREQFNEFFKQCQASGVFDDIVKRWIIEGTTEMPEIENPKNNGRLIVGVVSDKGLPFAIVKNNRIVGFDIELAERFAAYLGKELVLQDMEFGSLIPAVSSNKIDMIASTLVITEERKQQVDFSDPYYELGASVFALTKNLASYDHNNQENRALKLDDLNSKRIGVLTGSAGDQASRQRFPQAQIFNMDNIINATAALESNKIDAVVFERTSLQDIVKDHQDLKMIKEPVQLLDVAIAINKDEIGLLDSVNQVITALQSDGTLDDMKQRWFVDSDLPAMPKLAAPASQETLRVGTEALMPPFEFVDSKNECIGFDMELAQRIGQALGKKVVISNMSFPALIPALQSGKIDLAISCFNVTEERQQKVAFSKPYHTSETAAMVRKAEASPQTGGFFSEIKDSFYSNIILENRYLLILDGLKTTVIISIFAVLLGTLLGALVCLLRMASNRFLNLIARVYISILRGTPVLVLLMLIFYVAFASVNIDPVIVAIITFGMNFAAYVSEMFRTSIESIDKGQREAGIAGGFTALQTFRYIIMPQAVRHVLPVYKGEFISMVKMTSVVGYIAVQDLTKASDIIRSRTFDAFFPLLLVALLYFMISWLLALALDYIGLKTDPKRNRKSGRASA